MTPLLLALLLLGNATTAPRKAKRVKRPAVYAAPACLR